MHETPQDLERLQQLLDDSYATAGEHLREVITPDRRLDASTLTARLDGMRLLVLATVTADGRPITGPVDGIFYRGAFHFGSSPHSVRFRHIARRPQVSATHLPGEELSVSVHGRAEVLDMADPANAGLRKTVLDIYLPRYGTEWEQFMDSGVYARIDATRLYTFHMEHEDPAADGAPAGDEIAPS